ARDTLPAQRIIHKCVADVHAALAGGKVNLGENLSIDYGFDPVFQYSKFHDSASFGLSIPQRKASCHPCGYSSLLLILLRTVASDSRISVPTSVCSCSL